jgi:sulfide:quinone oxidoreductase
MIQQVNVNKTHHRILILGGGTAGIMTASLLRRAGQADIAILEPSSQHFYQPLWTLVGAGVVPAETTSRSEARYIPKGVRWIQDRGAEVAPDQQIVTTESSTRIGYDFLVVATGAQLNWNEIHGLEEAIRRGDASSNYGYQLAPKTWDLIRNFKGGTPCFTCQVRPSNAPERHRRSCIWPPIISGRKDLAVKHKSFMAPAWVRFMESRNTQPYWTG